MSFPGVSQPSTMKTEVLMKHLLGRCEDLVCSSWA